MVLALLRRVTPAGLLLASLAWLACSPDSDITGPVNVGGPNLAVTAGETYGWTTASGVTVTMQTLGALMENGQSQAFAAARRFDDDVDLLRSGEVAESDPRDGPHRQQQRSRDRRQDLRCS